MKTSELTGALLDYWVARAEVDAGRLTFDANIAGLPFVQMWDGIPGNVFSAGPVHFKGQPGEHVARGPSYGEWKPSTDWSFGGPIIERERIWLSDESDEEDSGDGPTWIASCPPHVSTNVLMLIQRGPTPLIAAMRAYVASKFGDEVPESPDAGKEN